MSTARVKASPAYDGSMTVSGAYEDRFTNYYGDIRVGDQP
jgi:hypothetical protein